MIVHKSQNKSAPNASATILPSTPNLPAALAPLLPSVTQSFHPACIKSTNACPSGLCCPSFEILLGSTTGWSQPCELMLLRAIAERVISAWGMKSYQPFTRARRYTECAKRAADAASGKEESSSAVFLNKPVEASYFIWSIG